MAMRVVEGRHGRFICQDNDQYVGRSLVEYGEYSEAEMVLLAPFLAPGAIVVEAGANIGAHTVPIAKRIGPQGRVYAFEPQRLMHQMLCGNLALNAIENVYALAVAVGDRAGQTRIALTHYGENANYGGIGLGGDGGEAVAMGTIDALRLDRLDLLKADVEGAEALLVAGAESTIRQCLPVLYLENDRRDLSPALLEKLRGLGYAMWWHLPFLFEPGNYRGNATNLFGSIASVNILCQHASRARPVPGLRAVTGIEDWPL
jgi:FkbM family methyltransferase